MRNNKAIIIALTVIPLIIIIVLIVYLGYFYSLQHNEKKDNANRYEYKKLEISNNYIVERYINQISDAFEESDLSYILSLIDLEDEKYAAMGSGDLLEIMENNGVLGKTLELNKYDVYNSGTVNKIYDTYVKTSNGKSINIVIKETYPDQYSIILGF